MRGIELYWEVVMNLSNIAEIIKEAACGRVDWTCLFSYDAFSVAGAVGGKAF